MRSSRSRLPGLDAGLGEVAGLGLVDPGGLHLAVRDLDRAVAVTVGRLDLHDTGRDDAQNRYRYQPVLLIPNLRHADFFADDRFGCHCSDLVSSHADAPPGQSPERSAYLGCATGFPS